MVSLLVVSDRITHGKHGHRLVACHHTPTKREVRRPTCQCVIGQYGGRGPRPLQNLESSTMEDAPARISSFAIHYFPKLIVSKHVTNGLHLSTLTRRFM